MWWIPVSPTCVDFWLDYQDLPVMTVDIVTCCMTCCDIIHLAIKKMTIYNCFSQMACLLEWKHEPISIKLLAFSGTQPPFSNIHTSTCHCSYCLSWKLSFCVSALIFQLFQVALPAKYVLLNSFGITLVYKVIWRFREKKRKSCHEVLTLSTQHQKLWFQIVLERLRTTVDCTKMRINTCAKHARVVFYC